MGSGRMRAGKRSHRDTNTKNLDLLFFRLNFLFRQMSLFIIEHYKAVPATARDSPSDNNSSKQKYECIMHKCSSFLAIVFVRNGCLPWPCSLRRKIPAHNAAHARGVASVTQGSTAAFGESDITCVKREHYYVGQIITDKRFYKFYRILSRS